MDKINGFVIPSVTSLDGNRMTVSDIFSDLMKENRILFIGMDINSFITQILIAQLLYLDAKDHDKRIHLYINSPGGSITDGLAIRDTIKFIKAPVETVCMGQCASMAAVILAAGGKGMRFALPSSRVLIHQPWANGGGGQETDIQLQAKEMSRMRTLLEKFLSEDTGQTLNKIHTDCDRDFIMTPSEAKEYGIIDEVIEVK